MKVEYLTNRAVVYAPLLTDMFSEKRTILKVENVNGVLKATTKEELNATLNSTIIGFIKNVPLRIDIDKIEKINDNEAFITTKQNHNQTKDPFKDEKVFIELQGFLDNDFNVKTEILEDYQDGGYKLRIKTNKAFPDNLDISNAFFYIKHDFKPNNLKKLTITGKNTFTFEENMGDRGLSIHPVELEGMYLLTNTRIYSCYDLLDAERQYCFNMGLSSLDNVNEEQKLKFKNFTDLTCYIALESLVENTAPNDTSVGYHTFKFSVFVFIPIYNIEKKKIWDMQHYLSYAIFNKIFGDKTLEFKNEILSINKSEEIKFLRSQNAKQRNEVINIFEMQYQFKLKTAQQDYKLPLISIRLNEIILELTTENENGVKNNINILT